MAWLYDPTTGRRLDQSDAQPAFDPQTGKPIPGTGPDPIEAALERARDAMAKGAPFDKAAGGFIASLAHAAHMGDQRVIAHDSEEELLKTRGYIKAPRADAEPPAASSEPLYRWSATKGDFEEVTR